MKAAWGRPGVSSVVYSGYGVQASGDAGISAAPVRSSGGSRGRKETTQPTDPSSSALQQQDGAALRRADGFVLPRCDI